MTPDAALVELLARVGASRGAGILISEEELGQWPTIAVKAMKANGLLVKARPAASAVCPGCEQECVMPVHTLPAGPGKSRSFIVCDKRSDINRVDVPTDRLEQWQVSCAAITELISDSLGIRRPEVEATSPGRWEIGIFKGKKHSSHLVLLADGRLTLSFAGHSMALSDVLALENEGFALDKEILTNLVDRPVAGAGDKESATQRRARLKKRVQAEKNKGNEAFLKTVAAEEGISVTRLKQLLTTESKPTRGLSRRSAY